MTWTVWVRMDEGGRVVTLCVAAGFIGVLPEHVGDTGVNDPQRWVPPLHHHTVYIMILIWLNTQGHTLGVTPAAKSHTHIPR